MDALYRNLAQAKLGYVESPAGCGKTEAIIRAVRDHSTGTQLILTHTNAGVSALQERFRTNNVSKEKYHIKTISGWAWSWVSKYPSNSGYALEDAFPRSADWKGVYIAATRLIKKCFVSYVIKNSYVGVIVDEYQDCTCSMHNLIFELKNILPCRVLGDPLQGIFDFAKEDTLVDWSDVKTCFANELGQLNVPYRWNNSGNPQLGKWLIDNRPAFQEGDLPDFSNLPVCIKPSNFEKIAGELKSIVNIDEDESICVIGPKYGNHPKKIISTLINCGFKYIEPNELSKVNELIKRLADASFSIGKKGEYVFKFIKSCYSGLTKHGKFIENILLGKCERSPSDEKRKKIYENFKSGYAPGLVLMLIRYLDDCGVRCQRTDSISCFENVLSRHIETDEKLIDIFNSESAVRRNTNRKNWRRVLGTTLLLKGLEFDHAVIVINKGDKLSSKDLYVAITRGSKSITIITLI